MPLGAVGGTDRAPGTNPLNPAPTYARHMTIRFCDDRGAQGFSWIVDEPMTRTSHALAGEGRVSGSSTRSASSPRSRVPGSSASQRRCSSSSTATTATAPRSPGELGVPHVVAPDAFPGSPFEAIPLKRTKRWRETALWWPARAHARRRRGDRHEPVLRGGRRRRRRAPAAPSLAAARRARRLRARAPAASGTARASTGRAATEGTPPGARPLLARASAGRASRARARRRRRTPPAVAAPRPVGTVTSRSTERSTTCGCRTEPRRRVSPRGPRGAAASRAAGGPRRAPAG